MLEIAVHSEAFVCGATSVLQVTKGRPRGASPSGGKKRKKGSASARTEAALGQHAGSLLRADNKQQRLAWTQFIGPIAG